MTPRTAEATRDPGRARPIGSAMCGIAVSLVAAGVVLASKVSVGANNPHWTASVGLAALTTLLLALLLMHPKYRGRAGGVACVATLGWLPVEAVAFAFDNEPVLTSREGVRCGMGWLAITAIAPVVAVVTLALASAIAVSTRRATLDAARRWVAVCSLVVTGVATLLGLTRIGRPTVDTYVASMPVVARLAPGESFQLDEHTAVQYRATTPVLQTSPHGAVDLCTLVGVTGVSFSVSSCPPLTLKHDRKLGLWVAEANAIGFAFKDDAKVAHDVYTAEIAPAVGPPVEWTVGGLFGFAFGVFAFVLGARATRRESTLDGIDGTLGTDRWVTHADGPPVRLTEATAISPGPVFLQLAPGTRSTYRETGGGAVVAWRRGTLDEFREELRGRAAALYALATTSALLCGAPLLLSTLGLSR